MRITSRGQITIPARLREKAGLQPLTDVDLEFDGEAVRIVPSKRPTRGRGAQLVKHLRGRGDVTMSTDEIMNWMRPARQKGRSPRLT